MPRTVTLASFAATVAIVVPVGWHRLDADIERDGKHVRSLQRVAVIDGVKVTLDVDRAIVTTGDTVTATLRAYADTPRRVAVDLTLFHSRIDPAQRVEPPVEAMDKEQLELAAAPGGGRAVTTKLKLLARQHERMQLDMFRIYVGRHGHKIRTGYDGDEDDSDAADAAGVGILGWSGNTLALAIEPQGAARDDVPFIVAVRVKNTTRHAMCRPWITLGTAIGLRGEIVAGDAVAIDENEINPDADHAGDDDGPDTHCAFAPGSELVRRFTVTVAPRGRREVAFVASALAFPDDGPGAYVGGAVDAKVVPIVRDGGGEPGRAIAVQ